MKLNTRRDQLAFFLGYASRDGKNNLVEAEKYLNDIGMKNLAVDDVFEFCPFNDKIEQIERGYNIFRTGKKSDLSLNISRLLEEFFFLFSDFNPPCCGDSRSVYGQDRRNNIILSCDRCGSAYSLDGKLVKETAKKRMSRYDFVVFFGEETADIWPFRLSILSMLNNR